MEYKNFTTFFPQRFDKKINFKPHSATEISIRNEHAVGGRPPQYARLACDLDV